MIENSNNRITMAQALRDAFKHPSLAIGLYAIWAGLGFTGNFGSDSFLIFFSTVSSDNVVLTWTAPGDDGNSGTATLYDLRYYTSQITDSNWNSATQVSGEPTPSVAGTLETMTISGLDEGVQYFFALKTVDEAGNWSALSNLASVTLPTSDSGGGDTGGDGGGGGSPTCTPSWTCGTWSVCSNGVQSRTCTDSSSCGTNTGKPATTQVCECQPNWICSSWGECDENNQQTRDCNDLNNCSADVFTPVTIQACGATTDQDTGGDQEPPLEDPTGTPPGDYYAGELLRTANSSAVYYIGTDFKKYVFPDSKTYFSWFENFDPVIWVTVDELDKYDNGGTMTYKPGTYLVTTPDTNRVYAVEGKGRLFWIPDEQTAINLYGSDWSTLVRDVIPGFFSSTYSNQGDQLSNYVRGTILKYNNQYYVVDRNNTARKFVGDGMVLNNFRTDFAITTNNLDGLNIGLDISSRETDLYYLR